MNLPNQFGMAAKYLAVPFVGVVLPVISIPVVTSQFGIDAWASLAMATGIGASAAVVVEMGWGVVGPQQIARSPEKAAELLFLSLATRAIAIVAALPLALVSTIWWVPNQLGAASLTCLAALLSSLNSSWIFVGLNKPGMILLTETLPKGLGTLLGIAAIFFTGELIWLPAIQLVAHVGSIAAGSYTLAGGQTFALNEMRGLRTTFWNQRVLMFGRAVSTIYTTLPSALVGAIRPDQLALFTAADRPARMGLVLLSAVPARFQSWIGQSTTRGANRAIRTVLIWNSAIGAVGGLTFLLIAPTLIPFLFFGQVSVSFAGTAALSLTVFIICVSRGLGLAVVSLGQSNRTVTASMFSAATAGIGLLLTVPDFGSMGAFWTIFVAELLGAVYLYAVIRRSKGTAAGDVAYLMGG